MRAARLHHAAREARTPICTGGLPGGKASANLRFSARRRQGRIDKMKQLEAQIERQRALFGKLPSAAARRPRATAASPSTTSARSPPRRPGPASRVVKGFRQTAALFSISGAQPRSIVAGSAKPISPRLVAQSGDRANLATAKLRASNRRHDRRRVARHTKPVSGVSRRVPSERLSDPDDSHCHLDSEKFDADREAVIERALASGREHMVAIGHGGGPPDLEPAFASRNV